MRLSMNRTFQSGQHRADLPSVKRVDFRHCILHHSRFLHLHSSFPAALHTHAVLEAM
jgi:hypothetical protein